MGWTVLVLIPKGTTDTRFVGLPETLWKMIKALIDTRLRPSLQFHYILHGFRSRREARTDIIELKLTQDLAIVHQDPLFLVFFDLQKAYDTVNRDFMIYTLEGYGAGPCM